MLCLLGAKRARTGARFEGQSIARARPGPLSPGALVLWELDPARRGAELRGSGLSPPRRSSGREPSALAGLHTPCWGIKPQQGPASPGTTARRGTSTRGCCPSSWAAPRGCGAPMQHRDHPKPTCVLWWGPCTSPAAHR